MGNGHTKPMYEKIIPYKSIQMRDCTMILLLHNPVN